MAKLVETNWPPPLCTTPYDYHTIPHHTTPHHTTPYHTIPYRTAPHRTVPYRTVPSRTAPYRTVPYHTIPYHTVPYGHATRYNVLLCLTPKAFVTGWSSTHQMNNQFDSCLACSERWYSDPRHRVASFPGQFHPRINPDHAARLWADLDRTDVSAVTPGELRRVYEGLGTGDEVRFLFIK